MQNFRSLNFHSIDFLGVVSLLEDGHMVSCHISPKPPLECVILRCVEYRSCFLFVRLGVKGDAVQVVPSARCFAQS